MTISYTAEERLPLLEYGSAGWDTTMNGAFEDWDEGKHLYLQAGEAIAQYDAMYIKPGDGKWWKAKADAEATMPTVAIAPEAIGSGAYGRGVIIGHITNAGWSFTIGLPVYLSSATAGAVTQIKPGVRAQVVGYAKTATKLVVLPTVKAEEVIVCHNDEVVCHNDDVIVI